ncbi:hypothetical protein [Paraburkholderia sp. J11-2]|uniref:hypothetical protein n=1 Tax=Paraburkholderia sp. J11-2 TaxID=2805431 RepID=UPI002AB796E5|nr:hypothetical protein [Paraburkholderia sp. J11-2]
MQSNIPTLPRGIPPQPTIAWFLRDLIPDNLWDDFDLGVVSHGPIDTIRNQLFQRGGADAWLRFIAQTRQALPQLLSISLIDTLHSALGSRQVWPDDVWLHCRPIISVYIAGRLVKPAIVLNCHTRIAFACPGEQRIGDYVLATTEVTLRHARQNIIGRAMGEYFVPVPPL